jgi:hypothetical protein
VVARTSRWTELALVHLLLAAAAAGATGCFGDIFGSDGLAVAREDYEFGLDLASQFVLAVEGKNGNVSVTGVPGFDSVHVRAVLEVSAETLEEAQAGIGLVWVDVDEFDEAIVVSTAQPEEIDDRNYVVNYEIRVPVVMWTQVLNINGNVTVAYIHNSVLVENSNGNVRLDDIAGSVEVQVWNGDVDADVTLPFQGRAGIAVDNGTIDLALPRSTSAWLLATTRNGTIDVVNLEFESEVRSGSALVATLGGGSGEIRLSTGNGGIRVEGYE